MTDSAELSHPALNFCPNCGVRLSAGQNFCASCGFDLRPTAQAAPPGGTVTTPRGLSKNAVVFATPDGLLGLTTHSSTIFLVAMVLPLPFLVTAFVIIQAGSLDFYAVVWMAAAGLLYDELRGRSLRNASYIQAGAQTQRHWFVPWASILMADWNGRTLWFSSAEPSRKTSITFDRQDAPSIEWNLSSRGMRYNRKSRRLPRNVSDFWTLAILLFIASQAILILAATLPLFPGESQVYTTILNNTKSQVVNATFFDQFRAIYANNIQVAWGGSLPVLGTIAFGVASYNTGRVIQVLAIGSKVPSAVVLLSLYVLPHTWFEEFSYPMAAAAGLLAITTWRSVSPGEFAKRRNRGSIKFLLALGGATLTLAFAGLLEVLVGYLGLGVVLLWIPIGLGAFVAAKWNRNRSRAGPQTGSP